MKKIFLITLLSLCLSGCTYFDDFEPNVSQAMTFKVRQVDLEQVVKDNPAMQVRQEISTDSPSAKPNIEEGARQGDSYRVNTDILNVRAEASSESEKVSELVFASDVEIIEEIEDENGNIWANINFDGGSGFVLKEYLTNEKLEEPIARYRAVVYVVNVRSGPTEDSEILGELGYFDEFDVFAYVKDENGKQWLKTMYNGTEAYVISDFCVEVE